MVLTRRPRADERWRDALPEEIPPRCRALARLAGEHGWQSRTTYAKGIPTGLHGAGIATVVETVPLESEDGRVLMTTPPPKKDGTPGMPRPRTRRVVSDVPIIVELVTLWLERPGFSPPGERPALRRLVATWVDRKGKGARSDPPGMTYKEAELKAVLQSDPAAWESLRMEITLDRQLKEPM